MAVDKKNLTQQEQEDLETKRDDLVEAIQKKEKGSESMTLADVIEYIKLDMELKGYEKEKKG